MKRTDSLKPREGPGLYSNLEQKIVLFFDLFFFALAGEAHTLKTGTKTLIEKRIARLERFL